MEVSWGGGNRGSLSKGLGVEKAGGNHGASGGDVECGWPVSLQSSILLEAPLFLLISFSSIVKSPECNADLGRSISIGELSWFLRNSSSSRAGTRKDDDSTVGSKAGSREEICLDLAARVRG